MKTTVVCGMLGSGKTTFIRNFLKNSGGKAVVLVNDFGALGIDGEIISSGGIEAVELPSGCVCCTLKAELIMSIIKIRETWSPDHLVIEPSGVAAPSGVLEALAAAGAGSASVIGIVDATEFVEFHGSGMYGSFFEDQIRNSDVVLVNKIDLAGEDLTGTSVKLVETLNPQALIFRTVNAVISEPLPNIRHPLPAGEGGGVRGDDSKRMTVGLRTEKAPFRFETLSFRLHEGASFAAMTDLYRNLAAGAFGRVVRAKALVQTDRGPCRFDISFGSAGSAPFNRDIADSRLVVIGEELDRTAIARALRLYGMQEKPIG